MKMNLPEDVEFLISRLNAHGHRADVVGGCVRDFLLGGVPHDYDITTSATPDEMHEAFSDLRTVDTGIKHGTVSVIINKEQYEITTYRIDGEYTDNRHPDSVRFSTSVSDDLSRRDFTVNAMCYNSKDGFTDLFGGMDDLASRTIRAVGDAEKRFSEDALRIIRALRFAAVLGFTIEEQTAAAIKKLAPLLGNVSRERILVEWRKLLCGSYAYDIISEFSSVIELIIPHACPLKLPERSRFAVAEWQTRELSLFANALGIDASQGYLDAMTELRSDTKHKELGALALAAHLAPLDCDTDLKHLLIRLGSEGALATLKLKILLGTVGAEWLEKCHALIDGGYPYRLRDLAVGGVELQALGIQGKKIGEVLNGLLYAIADGRVENEREPLLRFVSSQLQN